MIIFVWNIGIIFISQYFFEQPLIFDIERKDEHINNKITIVLYEISSWVLTDDTSINDIFKSYYSSIIPESNGMIILLDSFKITSLKMKDDYGQEIKNAVCKIASLFCKSRSENNMPIAICLSKMDKISEILSDKLKDYINSDYNGITNKDNLYKCMYDIRKHREIEKVFYDFLEKNGLDVVNAIKNISDNYSLFGFISLECNMEKGIPVGPINNPRRIEEPFLWLLSEIGFIETNEISCPKCGSRRIKEITLEKSFIPSLFLKKYKANSICEDCNYKFFIDED